MVGLDIDGSFTAIKLREIGSLGVMVSITRVIFGQLGSVFEILLPAFRSRPFLFLHDASSAFFTIGTERSQGQPLPLYAHVDSKSS